MQVKHLISMCRVVLVAGALGAASIAGAQTSTPPAAKTTQAPPDAPASRMDIFLGYSYFAPHGSVHDSPLPIGSETYDSSNLGATGSVSYFMSRYFGFTAEYGNHSIDNNAGFQTYEGGIIFRFPYENLTPFVHGLAGAARVGGPNDPGEPACTQTPCQPGTDNLVEPYHIGVGLTAGGGVDYALPFRKHHLSLRIFQADYEYIHDNFGPGNTESDPPGNVLGGRVNINSVKLSTGIVLGFGEIAPPPPVTYSCSVSPSDVFPGDPVTVTGTAGMLNPKKTATYTFTSSAGAVSGTGATGTIATASLAAGSYTVSGHVTEGNKAGQSADCTAGFVVKEYEPPTVSCSASPTTVAPGQSSTITAMGMSPQNRPLTYSYSASAGSISGKTSTATLSTVGAAPGTISITCTTKDDKGKSASATTSVTVQAPAPPPVPHAQKLCSIQFEHDKKRPARVDNEAKACLDEVALSLQQQSSATAVVVGESAPMKGKKAAEMSDKLAKERSVNTKAYLTTEKGVDASRVEVRTGPEGSNQVDNYLVPTGANLDSDFPGLTKFDEASVKVAAPKAPAKKAHKKKAVAMTHATPQ
jgi:hypothetical protein